MILSQTSSNVMLRWPKISINYGKKQNRMKKKRKNKNLKKKQKLRKMKKRRNSS
jgi:hypothetical protein